MLARAPNSCKLILVNYEFSEADLRRLDLNLLLVFAALMRERSVRRAANRLYLGPPAVSMALARLRETVGDPLFVRANAGMQPTPRALVPLHSRFDCLGVSRIERGQVGVVHLDSDAPSRAGLA